jgi:hypothetical protein
MSTFVSNLSVITAKIINDHTFVIPSDSHWSIRGLLRCFELSRQWSRVNPEGRQPLSGLQDADGALVFQALSTDLPLPWTPWNTNCQSERNPQRR